MITSNIQKPYSSRDLLWLLLPFLIAGVLSIVLGVLPPESKISLAWSGIAKPLRYFVPAIRGISSYTPNQNWAELLLGVQWLFAPIYIGAWMILFPPWSGRMRNAAMRKAVNLTRGKRIVFFIGWLLLLSYYLGDAGLLRFDTILNGRIAYPPTEVIPVLEPIYTSWLYLSLYAWVSPFIECTMLWVLIFMCVNFRAYLVPRRG